VTYPKDKEPRAQFFGVTAHAFATLQLPIVSGRDFTSDETERSTPVAIVNRVMADRLWPGAPDVVGRTFEATEGNDSRQFTIIGVTSSMSLATVRDAPEPYVFVPYPAQPDADIGLTIRARGPAPGGLANAARQQVRAADPMIAISAVMTGDVARANDYWADSLFSVMFSLFGSVAVVLGAIGVYGVVSYSVSQRTPEIGVRVALGATPVSIASLILSQVGKLAGLGIVAGVGAGFLATRVLRTFLYKVGAGDPWSFAAAAMFLAVIALLASLPPVRRATRVDPSVALRSE
jgi:putative ABC transport system permease protein